MQQAGMTVSFDRDSIVISSKYDKVAIRGNVTQNLSTIDFFILNASWWCNSACRDNYKILHQSLGHAGENKFLLLENKQTLYYVSLIESLSVAFP